MFLSRYELQRLVAIIIVLIMASLSIYQLTNFLQQDLTKNIQSQSTVNHSLQVKITSHSILFAKPIFGDYLPITSNIDIKESTLDVEIVGIVFSSNAHESQVLIKDAAGDERTYLIGDTLPGSAVIKGINKNGIVVLYNGSLESLSLPKNELLFGKPAKPLINGE